MCVPHLCATSMTAVCLNTAYCTGQSRRDLYMTRRTRRRHLRPRSFLYSHLTRRLLMSLTTMTSRAPATRRRSSRCKLLKEIAVQLWGPKGAVNTHALLDDGAELSVIDAELADTLGLPSESGRAMRFTDAFGIQVYSNEVPSVNLEIADKTINFIRSKCVNVIG